MQVAPLLLHRTLVSPSRLAPPHAWLQEWHAIGLAIRREVARRYRKLVAQGGKPEGSAKLWQQASGAAAAAPLFGVPVGCPACVGSTAHLCFLHPVQAFAQVMLLQQETIASLMGLLEQAKEEAAATLAPLMRPPSPTKRQALEREAEAAWRVRQDR